MITQEQRDEMCLVLVREPELLDREVAERFDVSVHVVKRQRRKLGLVKKRGAKSVESYKLDAIEKALRENPMMSDTLIADECGVSRYVVQRLRKQLGLWTSRRIRVRNGKVDVYKVKSIDEQDELTLPEISDTMLRQLHALKLNPQGQEAWELINDILRIVEGE